MRRRGTWSLAAGPGRRAAVRVLASWLAVLGGALLVVAGLGSGGREATADEAAVAQGGELYQRYCAVCHGSAGTGVDGVAPPVVGFSVAAVDLSMRTGRMPLADPLRGVRARTFTTQEREAVMAYLIERLDLEGELPDPPAGEAAAGRDVYALHCAQCHGASGKGGIAGDGVQIPPVVGLDPVTIAAATREGPFAMPRFGEALISDEEIGDIVAFLDDGVHAATTPIGLAEVSKFEAVVFAGLLTVGVALVCAWAGGARRRRAPRQVGAEAEGHPGA